MKRKLSILIVICLVSLTSCVKVPEQVKLEIENRKSDQYVSNSTEETNKLSFDTIENIFKTIDTVQSKQYDNLTFADDFTINKPEKIGEFQLKQIDNFLDHDTEVVKYFVGNTFQKKYMYTANTLPPGPEYDDAKEKIYFGMGDDGFFNMNKGTQYDQQVASIDAENEVARISLLKEYQNNTYELKDGKMSIKEAIKKAQKYADELSERFQDLTWEPIEVRVLQDSSDNIIYNVYFDKTINNVCFASFYPNCDTMNLYFTPVSGAAITISSIEEEPTHMANPSGIFQLQEGGKNDYKIITYECATNLVSNLLSAYGKKTVESVRIENRLVMTNKEYDHTGGLYADFDAGNTYETRPCWLYYLSMEPEREQYVIVDSISGDVQYINNDR